MICPKCESENVEIRDDSFDYGESHCGPAGTEVIKYPVCRDCGFGENDEDEWELGDDEDYDED